MSIGIVAGIAIAAFVISVIALFLAVKKKPMASSKQLDVQKISMDGFEIKIENGQLSLTPKK